MDWKRAVCISIALILVILSCLAVFHMEHIKPHICHCHCDESIPVEYEQSDCSNQIHGSLKSKLGGVNNDTNEIKTNALTKIHEILQMTSEAKKNIMRIKYGDADKEISTAITNLMELIRNISPEDAQKLSSTQEKEFPEVERDKIVCEEGFLPKKGFQTALCSDAKPIKDVVSILINTLVDSNSENLSNVLRGIETHYPGMAVHVAAKEALPQDMTFNLSLNVVTGLTGNAASMWKVLLNQAKTPYVLIGRNLANFDSGANLERAVRIAHTYGYDAVGGSVRDTEGKWLLGCQQHMYLNFTLKYKDGYFKSHNSCVICEHIFSPFIAKPELVKTVSMADNVQAGMLFEDFFIRMKRQKKKVINCPDVMYHVRSQPPEATSRDAWLSLVKERKLNRIYLSDGRSYRYSCGDAGISCSLSKSIATAPCCMEHLQYSIRDLFKECERQGLTIELNCGQLIGAVKLAGVLPWEKDGDVLYLTEEHKQMGALGQKMRALGYSWGEESPRPGCCWLETKKLTNGYYALRSSIWRTEVYGRGGLPSQFLKALGLTPTKNLIDGEWLQTPANPGLFSRNRYAHEVFRHQEHYFDVPGLGGGFAEYHPRDLNTCTYKGHQACLDQFHADGNIQFKQELL